MPVDRYHSVMANKERRVSETPATQLLRRHGITFTPHTYHYVDRGGTAESSKQLGWPEHAVVKTLVMQNEKAEPLVVLMHGDCSVSTKALARATGYKSIEPCTPVVAQRHSGYLVGGTSPFGLRKDMPIYLEASILDLEKILINGGRRGFLLEITPQTLVDVLGGVTVNCALAA